MFTRNLLLLSILFASVALAQREFIVLVDLDVPANAPFNQGWTFLRFTPANLTIQRGDTVTWLVQGQVQHTIIFSGPNRIGLYNGPTFSFPPELSPTPSNFGGRISSAPTFNSPLSSGMLSPGSNFSVTFDIASGTQLVYYDILHPFMNGVIDIANVSPSPSQVAALVVDQTNTTFNNMPRIEVSKVLFDPVPPSRPGSNGTTIWTIRIVGEANPLIEASLVRFVPDNVTIPLGDTLEFVNDDLQDHIVAFNGTQRILEDFSTPTGLNPIYRSASGGKDFRGGFATSGLLQPGVLSPDNEGLPQPQPNSWLITFNTLGTFPYECTIHDDVGMLAVVTVVARSS